MSKNILIVDDSPIVRAVIEKTLRMIKIPFNECVHASNGKEALEMLAKHHIDLCFVDINMPVMDGVALVEEMNQNGMIKKTTVVIVSTEGSATRIQHLREKGICDYLRKPFTAEQFKATVTRIMGNSHAA